MHRHVVRSRSRSLRLALGLAVGVPALALGATTAAADAIGPQFQVSNQAPPGNAAFDADNVDLAYNEAADQYLAVWRGETAVDGETEIFGRLLDGSGTPLGGVFQISTMGPNGNAAHDANDPAVAYSPTVNEYLVVWEGDEANNEDEIYGQRLSATGAQVGPDDFRISDMGPDGNGGFDARDPDVAYNPQTTEYLAVWEGDDDTGALVGGEDEIYGQRLDVSGAEVGTNDFRISDVGADGDTQRDGINPAVTHNTTDNEYLVVWEGDEANNEDEIYGQRLGQGGGELGTNDFRISDMGPDGNDDFDGEDPAVAHLSTVNEYLVVFEGDDDTAPLVDNENEIFGQRLAGATGAEVGTNDFRISDMGPDGNDDFDAFNPEIAANPRAGEYQVAWEGDDDTPPLVDNKLEIFGQRVSAAGAEVGTNDFRVSVTETQANAAVDANRPNPVAYNSMRNQYLVGWDADSDVAPLVDNEKEVYVRAASAGAIAGPPPPLCAAAPTPPTPSTKGTVTLSVRQLRINQNIYSAAINRAKAINEWLDAGIEARDICGGGITGSVLDAGVSSAPGGNGAIPASSMADPRPITPKPLTRDPNADFKLTTGQLQTNQRIASRAVRDANALQARLDGKLSGGDVDDGVITSGKISTGITITGATPDPTPPAPTTTDVKPAQQKTGVTFTLTDTQLGINQQIGQTAISRLNTVRGELLSGLDSEDFKPGTITAQDLAPGVAPGT